MIKLLNSEVELFRGSWKDVIDLRVDLMAGLFPDYRSSMARGYLSRKKEEAVLCFYCGQWGVGITMYTFTFRSSRYVNKYYFLISYDDLLVLMKRIYNMFGDLSYLDKFKTLSERATKKYEKLRKEN